MKPARGTALCSAFFLVMLEAALAQHVQTDFDSPSQFLSAQSQKEKP